MSWRHSPACQHEPFAGIYALAGKSSGRWASLPRLRSYHLRPSNMSVKTTVSTCQSEFQTSKGTEESKKSGVAFVYFVYFDVKNDFFLLFFRHVCQCPPTPSRNVVPLHYQTKPKYEPLITQISTDISDIENHERIETLCFQQIWVQPASRGN